MSAEEQNYNNKLQTDELSASPLLSHYLHPPPVVTNFPDFESNIGT